ncbi:MAG: hypothetical protein INR73_08670 [Williamsia sp.]|nr:hypothetical protein [Williamsia sp.]
MAFKCSTNLEVITELGGCVLVIIDSAKVENEFVKLTGTNGSGFMPVMEGKTKDPKQIEGSKDIAPWHRLPDFLFPYFDTGFSVCCHSCF